LGGLFDISSLKEKKDKLDKEMFYENGWDNVLYAQNIAKELASVNKTLDEFNEINDSIEALELLKDELSGEEYNKELNNIQNIINNLEKKTHLSGEYDNLNCYLEIHPGAGGTESCDWASMLLRMYERFCEKNDYKYEVIYETPGDEAGLKSALILIKGEYAYGYLKKESGVHRLVRISPFDSNARRHTSFASVTITPEFNDTKEIEVKESDLKVDVYHSSGAGGQSVNTSNSAVRITHLPTKIVVTCQNERSQLKNKEIAINILKNKLYELYLKEEESKKNDLKGESLNIEWGSQIRSYVLEPYKLVKDNRSNYENNNPDKILDGDILEMLEFNLINIK
jgi:peptide chain release factor 2